MNTKDEALDILSRLNKELNRIERSIDGWKKHEIGEIDALFDDMGRDLSDAQSLASDLEAAIDKIPDEEDK